ncbi:T9SS type A sorting domain-containing protein, partial [Maribacter flavus]
FGHRRGGMLSYPVTVSGGSLEVGFLHGPSENPLVNAIEVLVGQASSNLVQLKSRLPIGTSKLSVNDVTLIPNPVFKNEKITVQLVSSIESLTFVSMYSLNGALVYQKSFTTFVGHNEMELFPENLEAGIYLVKISTAGNDMLKKIIVKN